MSGSWFVVLEVVVNGYRYLPESLAQQLSYALEAQDGEPGVDFFYGSSADKRLGNITFTLQIPGGGSKIDIVIPPSVLYQPITALRDYIPVGNANFDHYLPVKTFKDSSNQPIILGRTYVKPTPLTNKANKPQIPKSSIPIRQLRQKGLSALPTRLQPRSS